jgi:hypothetical protein
MSDIPIYNKPSEPNPPMQPISRILADSKTFTPPISNRVLFSNIDHGEQHTPPSLPVTSVSGSVTNTPPDVQQRIDSTKRIIKSIQQQIRKPTDPDSYNIEIGNGGNTGNDNVSNISSTIPQVIRSSLNKHTPVSLHDKIPDLGDNTPPSDRESKRNILSNVPNTAPPTIQTGMKRPFSLDFCTHDDMWTPELENYFLQFINLLQQSADKCRRASLFHKRLDWILSLVIIMVAAVLSILGFVHLSDDVQTNFSITAGIVIAIVTGAQSKGGYDALATLESDTCLALEKNSRLVRLELAKPVMYRVSPDEFIAQLENKREKLLRKVGISDE